MKHKRETLEEQNTQKKRECAVWVRMGIQREQAKATSKQRKRGKRNYITHTELYIIVKIKIFK